MERSKSRLKDPLVRVFCGSLLLRSACPPTTTATSATRSVLEGIAQEPVYVPSSRRHLHDRLQHRSLSFPAYSDEKRESFAAVAGRLSVDYSGCRPSRSSNISKKASYSPWKCNEKKSSKKKVLFSNTYVFTNSSSEKSDGEFGLFSCRSFSSDSSEFYQRSSSNNKNKKKKTQRSSSFRRPPRTGRARDYNGSFRPVAPMKSLGDNNGKEELVISYNYEENNNNARGIPVVKRTVDPYGDFRSSMVEMIVERQIFSADELERLLVSYLSLNSHRHHLAILQAFSDICDVLFAY